MHNLLPRAASCCRQSLLRVSPSRVTPLVRLPARVITISTQQTASYTVETSSPPKARRDGTSPAIPRHKRPLTREPLPPPTKTPEELATMPYIVRRTPYAQLPVYRQWMSGGNRQIILVKKVDGDRRKLLGDMSEALSIDKEDIRINPTTLHIEIKGDYFVPARKWLMECGF